MTERFDLSDPDQHAAGLAAAAEAISKGELIVLPTDTVYGIGADAFTPWAVSRLLAAKGRGRDMPPPVLVGTVRAATALVDDFGAFGQDLIDEFWPGGLTLVARATPTLAWDLGDTKGTVAVRMPLHAAALDLLKKTGPMAVSSANTTGRPAATTADEAMEQLGDSVAVYLDGGPCGGGVASTIIDLTGSVPRLLRAGAISMDRLREVASLVTGEEVSPPGDDSADGTAGIPDTAPAPDDAADPAATADTTSDGTLDAPPDIPSESPADARAAALSATDSPATASPGRTPEAWALPGEDNVDPIVPAQDRAESPAEKLMEDSAQAQEAADDPAAPVTSESVTAAPFVAATSGKKTGRTRKPPAAETPAPQAAEAATAAEPARNARKAAAPRKPTTPRKPATERVTRKPAAERKTTPRRTAARKTTPADPPTMGEQTDTVSQPGDAESGGPA
jgi:L-threonylcarbamoyladenylate synthase